MKNKIPVSISSATVQFWNSDMACLLMQDLDLYWIFSDKSPWIRDMSFIPGAFVYVYWAKRGQVLGVVDSEVVSVDDLPQMEPITE